DVRLSAGGQGGGCANLARRGGARLVPRVCRGAIGDRAAEKQNGDERQGEPLLFRCHARPGTRRRSRRITAVTGMSTARATATTIMAPSRPSENQSTPKPTEAISRETATAVCAAAMPLARVSTGVACDA